MAIYAAAIEPDAAVWGALAPAAGTPDALAAIKRQHESGKCSVLKMAGGACGYVVLWMERDQDDKRELVLGLGVGRHVARWIPWAVAFARENQAASIRTHCKRAGLIRLYEKQGFIRAGEDSEGFTVLRWKHGR